MIFHAFLKHRFRICTGFYAKVWEAKSESNPGSLLSGSSYHSMRGRGDNRSFSCRKPSTSDIGELRELWRHVTGNPVAPWEKASNSTYAKGALNLFSRVCKRQAQEGKGTAERRESPWLLPGGKVLFSPWMSAALS